MNRPYVITPKARHDIVSIVQYIGYIGIENEKPEAAAKLSARLSETMSLLASHLGMGHPNELLAPVEFHFWPVGPYLIIYRPNTEPLPIIRVWHAKRGTPDRL